MQIGCLFLETTAIVTGTTDATRNVGLNISNGKQLSGQRANKSCKKHLKTQIQQTKMSVAMMSSVLCSGLMFSR